MDSNAPHDDDDILEISSLVRRLIVGLIALVAASFMAGITLRGPITVLSEWFVDLFGLSGIFFGVLILDCLPLTMSEPLLLLGYEGNINFWVLTTVAGLGSWLSALLGYSTGLLIGKTERMKRVFRRYRMDRFMKKYGLKSEEE